DLVEPETGHEVHRRGRACASVDVSVPVDDRGREPPGNRARRRHRIAEARRRLPGAPERDATPGLVVHRDYPDAVPLDPVPGRDDGLDELADLVDRATTLRDESGHQCGRWQTAQSSQ